MRTRVVTDSAGNTIRVSVPDAPPSPVVLTDFAELEKRVLAWAGSWENLCKVKPFKPGEITIYGCR